MLVFRGINKIFTGDRNTAGTHGIKCDIARLPTETDAMIEQKVRTLMRYVKIRVPTVINSFQIFIDGFASLNHIIPLISRVEYGRIIIMVQLPPG